MTTAQRLPRRTLLLSAAASMARAATPPRFAHRQASMRETGAAVFALARRIPGLSGVELQIHYQGQTLWDRDTMLAYRRAAADAGIAIPSLSGVWEKGVSLRQTTPGEQSLRRSIAAAEALGARVILVAAFRDNCPRMDEESSFGPVVAMLRKVSPAAQSAGVILGLETSLSPADDAKLAGLVGSPAVKTYFDLDNTEFYGHTGQSLTGIRTLGKAGICQVHCKNEDRLLEEPGRVNWTAAIQALKQTGYDGWFVFETRHSSAEQCVSATARNIAFLRRLLA
ncbi:MAG: sugar phosphate isomerase/epimerase family protein [Bryobacteraceae bacterium]|nr:sugar phosphate isomerase/epimerase family protein [Bryobacteraceae bacterium]